MCNAIVVITERIGSKILQKYTRERCVIAHDGKEMNFKSGSISF